MALLIERRGRLSRWNGGEEQPALMDAATSAAAGALLRVALVNNMPDTAIEDTEEQFFALLDAAAGQHVVVVKLLHVAEVPRGERAASYLAANYTAAHDCLSARLDGAIITGTEPKLPDLRKEPYWGSLSQVLDWAESNTTSSILSCLAAHAGVLYRDGIARKPTGSKRFGVFEQQIARAHALTKGLASVVCIPHSRWNAVAEEDLVANGYEVLTKSGEAGVDLFVKQTSASLFVHFQGHPEYGERTLLKEYRRDVKRYLRGERNDYPPQPLGYFDANGSRLAEEFQKRAEMKRDEAVLAEFPEQGLAASLRNRWRESAATIYRNWLEILAAAAKKNGSEPQVELARAERS